jgi:hypothetical protein
MYPNPESFDNITPWLMADTKWAVVGVRRDADDVTIKSGFRNKALALAWLNVYLERYVKEHMFPQYLEGPEFEYLDSTD